MHLDDNCYHHELTQKSFLMSDSSAVLSRPSFLQSKLTHYLALVLHSVLLISLVGCANNPKSSPIKSSRVLQLQRESTLNAAWAGKRYEALVENFGEPVMRMNNSSYPTMATTIAVSSTAPKCLVNHRKYVERFVLVV